MTDTADPTNGASLPAQRDVRGRFGPGNKIGTGRRKGARSKLSESFLADFHRTWLKHGAKALDKVAQENPGLFVKTAAAILPRVLEVDGLMKVDHVHRTEFQVELGDFVSAYRKWGSVIGANPKLSRRRL